MQNLIPNGIPAPARFAAQLFVRFLVDNQHGSAPKFGIGAAVVSISPAFVLSCSAACHAGAKLRQGSRGVAPSSFCDTIRSCPNGGIGRRARFRT